MAKVLFLFVAAIFLAQDFCGAQNDGKDVDILDKSTLAEMKDMLARTVSNGKRWLEDAFKEIESMQQKNEKTQELEQEIVAFLTKARTLSSIQDEEKKLDEMDEAFGQVKSLFYKYDFSNVKSIADTELESLYGLLTRNGMNIFQDQFFKDITQFTGKVIASIEKYIKSLSSKERRNEVTLIKNLKRLKAEKDLKKKFDISLEMI